ncbi:hypothetical protein X801_01499 [Opisthorchis viverrini]|uniref:Uncharacterized protein n=1 Tax=Opisthorchis viverrini TaxID=6198 RepID=A0A1S8X7C5_OPIVI|nr:hypothetical protein X801_01499 [Opisthorchis viverrini]
MLLLLSLLLSAPTSEAIACLQDVEGEGWTTLETDCRYCELIDNGRVVKRNCLYKKRKKKKCKHHFLCKIDFCNQCFGDAYRNQIQFG